MTEVKDYLDQHEEKLDFFTNAITIAHGQNHPEVFDVRKEYLNLKDAVAANADLNKNFDQLRETTKNYAIPNDVCQTFEATYHMLKNADAINARG
ncbi:hypothetical protein [Companilactobacillus ginsenosidimutans]|uniref:Iron-sulfur cluster repair di-iron protein, ric n=1 Tax=Companilactobacillus ginsenosidimutans TaxID=1007676 RepID=A0A0H4QHL9_9LACO|nr:hypothetical protein [Companilactobacillus ginsenosidimutans]AKP67442.1 hypothetical protein ABM34_07775 [Companilactobacillus ginsenosidimutans]